MKPILPCFSCPNFAPLHSITEGAFELNVLFFIFPIYFLNAGAYKDFVNDFIQQLLHLQDLEQALEFIREKQRTCEANENARQRLENNLRTRLSEAKQALKEQEKAYQAQELHLNALEDRVVQLKTKQISVKKSEEYQALNTEIAALTQEISDLQDQLLAELEDQETSRAALRRLEEETNVQHQSLQLQAEKLAQQRSELKQQEDAQAEKLQAFEQNLQGSFYEAYVNLRRCGKTLPRVVPVRHGKCMGCFLTLPKGFVDQLKTAKDPMYCEHCGRILYFEE